MFILFLITCCNNFTRKYVSNGHHPINKFICFSQDVISTGYFPYAQYVRDYNPPPPVINSSTTGPCPGAPDPGVLDPRVSSTSPMYSTISNTTMPNRQSSLLNVTDPRYSATYGNPLLRQVCIKIFYIGKGKI